MSLLVFYLWMLTRHPQVYMCIGLYLKMTESEEYSEFVLMSMEYCTSLWLLHDQRSMVRSQFLFVEGLNAPSEPCPCGRAALLFHLEGSYGSLTHMCSSCIQHKRH